MRGFTTPFRCQKIYTQTKIQNRHKIHLSYLDIPYKFMNPFFSCLPSILKKSGGEFGLILALWNYRNISNNFSFVLRNCSEKRSCPFSPRPELFANSKIFPNWVERASRLPLQNGVSKCRHPLTIPYFRPPLSSCAWERWGRDDLSSFEKFLLKIFVKVWWKRSWHMLWKSLEFEYSVF